MKVLDLFSGIGGFSLGLERAGMETVAFCEIDLFCQKVLKKHWPNVPIYDDITKLKGGDVEADLICGGYPCQPFSVAGNRRGKEDDRHLWPEMFRIIKEVRPTWVVCENVYGHISMGLDEVLSDLEAEGYSTKVFIVPACGVDAPHKRDRVWIVAHSSSLRLERDTPCSGIRTKENSISKADGETTSNWHNLPEPYFIRSADGVPRRMDRIRGLGNAVVPQIPEQIGIVIMSLHGED